MNRSSQKVTHWTVSRAVSNFVFLCDREACHQPYLRDIVLLMLRYKKSSIIIGHMFEIS